MDKPMIMLGAAMSVISWIAEADIHAYVFKQGSFSQWLYPASNTNELWMRFVISALFLGFGFVAQRALEYKRHEETKLKEGEAKYRTLFESSADAIMLLNQKEFFDCNAATLKMFGCTSQEEFLKKHPAEFSPSTQPNGEDSLKLADQHIATAFDKGSTKFEWIFNRLDGTEFPAEVWLTTTRFGNKCFLQATVRDISEHKQAAIALAESEFKFRTLAESTTVGIFLFREHFLYTNPQCSEMSGYSPEQLLQMGVTDLLPPNSADEVLQNWEKRKRGDAAPKYSEVQFLTKNGKVRWGQLMTAMIYFEGLPTSIGSVVDITDRKQAEEKERQRLARELHDELGQSLTMIKTELSRAASQLWNREELAEIIRTIDGETDQVIAATRNMLQRLHPRGIDSIGLVGALTELTKHWEEVQDIPCTFDSSGDLDDLNNNTQLALYRIVQESLTNIAKHAGARHVQVRCYTSPANDSDSHRMVTLMITDDGIGIKKPGPPPQGLGLAGMRKRVQDMGGSIKIESFPNKGTRIFVSVPLEEGGSS